MTDDLTDQKQDDQPGTKPLLKKIGIACIILSFVFYGSILLMPFIPYDTGTKALITTGLVICGETIFWVGCLILGREFAAKYRKYFNPRNWFKKKTTPDHEQ